MSQRSNLGYQILVKTVKEWNQDYYEEWELIKKTLLGEYVIKRKNIKEILHEQAIKI